MSSEPRRSDRTMFTLEQRVFLLETAISLLQDFGRGPYLHRCVNAALDPDTTHPHWDSFAMDLIRSLDWS